MSKKNNEFLEKLLSTFKVEATEHVRAISSRIVELEKASESEKRTEIIEAVFREAHSLKGAARAVNLVEIETVCQSLETVFSALKRKEVALSISLFDRLHKAVDTLGGLLFSLGAERPLVDPSLIEEVIRSLDSALKELPLPAKAGHARKPEDKDSIPPQPEPGAFPDGDKPILAETVRVSTAKLDSLFLQAEELLSAKLTANQRAADIRGMVAAFSSWEKERAKTRPSVRTLQHLLERERARNGGNNSNPQLGTVLEFLEWENALGRNLESKLATLAKWAEQDQRSLGRMVDDLLEDMKKVLMLPFSSLLDMFPKFVRDLSRDRDKEVNWVVQGAEIEIDRRILEETKDPFIHLVRNCIDHGIEKAGQRERMGKPRRGTVSLVVAQTSSNKVEIAVNDDGAGIDLSKVRGAAAKFGFISPEEAAGLDEKEVLSLVFRSGVSTSPLITDISGRGLGLAIVQEKVEKLGGTISVETKAGAGTTFRIVLPLSVATFRGILVRVDEDLFVLPTAGVDRLLRAGPEEIKTVENRETIQLNGQALSLVRLGRVLELPQKKPTSDSVDKRPVVILGSGETLIAFLVDEILAEQEVLVKGFGQQLGRVRNIAGATVLGTGKVVPILNVSDLMRAAVRVSEARGTVKPTPAVKEEVTRKSVLVVEDSITARTLLKNILEAAGYSVKTAVDGLDALAALKTEPFELVVSDVDMPRMNGFDLAAKIRSDKKLSELPVVLVTALESREDRERGIDVGANAYIVKSSFDQSNLLEVIRRFI